MAKIENDKYYTSPELAQYCVDKAKEIIGEENIAEWLEPSGGNGVFLDYLPDGTYSCDIEPEDNRIIKQDYLELDTEYKKDRCIIGNPPFGRSCNLAVQFYKMSIRLGDYIVFILPISQLNNTYKFYEFDLLFSEDLGKMKYSDKTIHCCLNIFKRNPSGNLNKKIPIKYKDVEIKISEKTNSTRDRIITKEKFNYDIRFCIWGSVGVISKYEHEFAKEMCVKINNNNLRDKILDILTNVKWTEVYPMTATPNLLQWQVYKYLKEQIQELE